MSVNKKIIFRTEFGPFVGLGHLIRCLRLAELFKLKKFDPIFVIYNETSISNLIKKKKIKVQYVQNARININENISWAKIKASLVVIDGKEIKNNYFNNVSKFNSNILTFSDFKKINLNINHVINNHLWAENLKFPKNIKYLYFGPKYNLLHNNYFLKPKKNKNLLITMGGDDFRNVTLKLLKALNTNLKSFNKVYVIIGNYHPNPKIVSNFIQKNKLNIELIYRPNSLLKYYKICQYAITGCGTTVYEIIASKIIFGYVVLDRDQVLLSKFLNKHKVGINFGNSFTSKKNIQINYNKLIKINKKNQSKKYQQLIPFSGSKLLINNIINNIT